MAGAVAGPTFRGRHRPADVGSSGTLWLVSLSGEQGQLHPKTRIWLDHDWHPLRHLSKQTGPATNDRSDNRNVAKTQTALSVSIIQQHQRKFKHYFNLSRNSYQNTPDLGPTPKSGVLLAGRPDRETSIAASIAPLSYGRSLLPDSHTSWRTTVGGARRHRRQTPSPAQPPRSPSRAGNSRSPRRRGPAR